MKAKAIEIVYGDLDAILRYSREYASGVSSYTSDEKRIIISYYLSNRNSQALHRAILSKNV